MTVSTSVRTKLLPVLVLVGVTAGSQAREAANDSAAAPRSVAELEASIDRAIEENRIPGAAVAIVSRDSIVWIGVFGMANCETGTPVTEDTHFGLGSCTKSFTGLAFLKLLDEGRFDLNTPVREIAPEMKIDNPWAETHPVRVVHLLEHTSGFEDSHPNWFYFDGPVMPLRRALEQKAHLRRVRWPPGTRFSYSSAGYTLAGYVLEKVTGQRYEDHLKEALLEPIGMTTSTIGSSEECRQRLAVGYDKHGRPFPTWYDYDEPAGAMNSSIEEMSLFVQFLLNRGAVGRERIVSEDWFDKIGKPTSTVAAGSGLEGGYSFGIGTRYRGGTKWYGHGGAVPGFLSEYAYNLDGGLGFVVLQNSFDNIFSNDVFELVWQYVISGVDSVIPAASVSAPAGRLKDYCGYYESRNPRMHLMEFAEVLFGGVTILYEHDTLYSQGFMDRRRPLIPVTESLFRLPEHPEASRVFAEASDGTMVFASQGSYYEKTDPFKPIVYRTLFFGVVLVLISSVAYALVWVPVHLYRRVTKKSGRSAYLWMRVVPLTAVLSLLLGVIIAADQTLLDFGRMSPRNVVFFVATLLFAVLSVLSLFTSWRSFFKPVKAPARIYAIVLSSACLGATMYLGYWGLIGLRLWAY